MLLYDGFQELLRAIKVPGDSYSEKKRLLRENHNKTSKNTLNMEEEQAEKEEMEEDKKRGERRRAYIHISII
ncbi:hypothetical protein MUK42_33051 [Musa troglodytarum]|uniref:Uncharacterized protein n=1 Tax=Musa troglodytarum TaxID=320322 RepID=A0A9E7HWF6_9LILI|nr:hypothetical protein MUK42_33051 [Musa troglodytarum]